MNGAALACGCRAGTTVTNQAMHTLWHEQVAEQLGAGIVTADAATTRAVRGLEGSATATRKRRR